MSRVTGAERVKTRGDYVQFIKSYSQIISKFPGFISAQPSGSYKSDINKETFGDIDLILSIQSDKDKVAVKKELTDYLLKQSSDIIVPFSSDKYKGRRAYNSGEIVTVRFYNQKLGYSVQIDNILALDKTEVDFKQNFLNWPAEKQGLILGLVKVATVETEPQILFKKLGITIEDIELEDNQEYEFNLSSVELQLRLITYIPGIYKESKREILWKSRDLKIIEKLLYQFDLNTSFEDLMEQAQSKLKNRRSKTRMAGIFTSMISVKSGEVGTEKGASKQRAIDIVSKKFTENITFKNFFLLEEIADLDAIPTGSIPVVLFIGRFQPFHNGHLEFIKKISSKYPKYKVLIGIVKGLKSSLDKDLNPLPFDIQKKIILKGLGEYSKNVIIFPREFSSGYIPSIFEILRGDDYEVKVVIAGQDRATSYKEVISFMNVNFKTVDIEVNVADKRYFAVSGTQVRETIKNDNFEEFKKLVPEGLYKYFWELQKYIKGE